MIRHLFAHPLAGAQIVFVRAPLLRVLQEEVHCHEHQDKGEQGQTYGARQPKPPFQACAVLQKVLAHLYEMVMVGANKEKMLKRKNGK